MEENKFEKEIPIGLAMSLGMNEFAMEYYATLDNKTRKDITNYVQSSTTGNEAKERIENTIKNLSEKNTDFLL